MAPTMTSGDGMRRRGFTLIELLVVLAIIATLLSLAMPQYFRQQDKARETVLRHNLVTLRKALDDELVQRRYLRELPLDPVTNRRDSWVFERSPKGGIADVHSGASGKAHDGTDYASW